MTFNGKCVKLSVDNFRQKRHYGIMKHMPDDPKLAAILDSAWTAFTTYGFRKTSMDDVARGAGMSRPALYLRFKNKEDIFRSLVIHYYDVVEADVRAVLSTQGAPVATLEKALRAQSEEFVKAKMASLHGAELSDANFGISGDLVTKGEARLTMLYAEWMVQNGAQEGWSAQNVACTMSSALKGIKLTAPDFDTYLAEVKCLAELVCAAVFGTRSAR